MTNDELKISEEEAPPPPPAPPFEGPSPVVPVQPYRQEDTQLKEILSSQVSADERKNHLIAYQELLKKQLEIKKEEMLNQETARNLAEANVEINKSELERLPKKINEFTQNIQLLPGVPKITEERISDLSQIFKQLLTMNEEKQKKCLESIESLNLKLQTENDKLDVLRIAKDLIYFKIKAVERAIVAVEKEADLSLLMQNTEDLGSSKKRKMAMFKDLSVYENELRDEWELFTTIINTKKRTTIYSPEEILALQCAILEQGDWEGEPEVILQHKLWKAVVERKELIKGLDKTPRANIKEILGYDIIEEYRERERRASKHKADRKNLKPRRTFEQKEVTEASSVFPSEDDTHVEKSVLLDKKQEFEARELEQSTKRQRSTHNADEQGSEEEASTSSKKRSRSPNQRALITELTEKLAEKQELLKQAEESRLKAEERTAAIIVEQEGQRLLLLKEQQEAREAKSRAEADLARAQALRDANAQGAKAPRITFAQRTGR